MVKHYFLIVFLVGFSFFAHGSQTDLDATLVPFSFDQVELKDILNDFAQKKKINLLYSSTAPLTHKISFDAGKKITFKDAWELLIHFLDVDGFQLVPQENDLFKVVQKSTVSGEMLPLYIDVHHKTLPNTKQIIRYLYYFNNIDIADSTKQNDIKNILGLFLNVAQANSINFNNGVGNFVLLTADGQSIRQAMDLLVELDDPGVTRRIEMVTCMHANAVDVATNLSELISGQLNKQKRGPQQANAIPSNLYFSPSLVIKPIDPDNKFHMNGLIIIGEDDDIKKVVDFIKKYIDVPLLGGKSSFHVVELDWQSADDMRDTLRNIIDGKVSSKSGQSTTAANLTDLAFGQVVVECETITTGGGKGGGGTQQNTVQRGGNRLIIACNERDWLRIKKLIAQLDVPQKQVIIEAMILDLDINFIKKLSSQIRNRGFDTTIFPKYMQAQASMAFDSVLQVQTGESYLSEQVPSGAEVKSLIGDLSVALDPSTKTLPTDDRAGTVFIFSQGIKSFGAWAFFQLVSSHKNSKVLTKPFTVAQNNQTAHVESFVEKRLKDKAQQGVSSKVNYENIKAPISLDFTPLISDNNTVNLQIDISIDTYIDPVGTDSGERNIRELKNNVSLKSGDVLVLGGLTQESLTKAKNSVPGLSAIPVLGNLFSSRSYSSDKTQLFILIRPTVIMPRRQKGMGKLTRNAYEMMNQEMVTS
ncbi:hypothetical protein EBQ93_05050, partial [bacterium]|nr:hypothetical protein [bacterium]